MTKNGQYLDSYENINLEHLGDGINRGSYFYKIVERTKEKCIYKVVDKVTKKIAGYEVFLNKISPKLLIDANGKKTLSDKIFKEYYPGNEEFGSRAWFYNDLNLAYKKYQSIGICDENSKTNI